MPQLHPDRFTTTGVTTRKLGVVVHDAESGDGAAQTLVRLLQQPGDRVVTGSNPPRKYGSGYTAVTDGNGGYIRMAAPTWGPYAAPPRNKDWEHICMPGVAAQTREQWLDELSRNHIRGVAQFIFDAHIENGVPLERVNPGGLLAGDRGYCGHIDVTNAWHDSDHTDPGPNFPWDVLAADIALLAGPAPTPTEDDEMPIITNEEVRDGVAAYAAKWGLMDTGRLRWLDPVEYAARGSLPGIPWKNDSLDRHHATFDVE